MPRDDEQGILGFRTAKIPLLRGGDTQNSTEMPEGSEIMFRIQSVSLKYRCIYPCSYRSIVLGLKPQSVASVFFHGEFSQVLMFVFTLIVCLQITLVLRINNSCYFYRVNKICYTKIILKYFKQHNTLLGFLGFFPSQL